MNNQFIVMAKIVAAICCIFLLFGCHAQPAKGVELLAPKAYAEKLNATPNPQILDVRSPAEFESGHLENAVNVNWNGGDFTEKAAKYDPSKPVFVYCKIGGRSKQAAAKLSEMGFTQIYDLQGGIAKWDEAGLSNPTKK